MFTHTETQYDLEILHHGCDSPVYSRVVIGLRVLNTSTSLLSVSMESMALHKKNCQMLKISHDLMTVLLNHRHELVTFTHSLLVCFVCLH